MNWRDCSCCVVVVVVVVVVVDVDVDVDGLQMVERCTSRERAFGIALAFVLLPSCQHIN